MHINIMPVTSCEVRWFLEGSVGEYDGLRRWFQTVDPWPPRPVRETTSYAETRPAAACTDIYLLVPGASDMGIKWRDGMLQLKGRLDDARARTSFGRFRGNVERWVKWSYDDLTPFFRNVFAAPPPGAVTVPVRKIRALRKLSADPLTGWAEEVPPDSRLARGVLCELTDVEVSGQTFCTLAFEAFPYSPRMADAFTTIVETCLESLEGQALAASHSMSYPAWLGAITGWNARPVMAPGRRLAATGSARG